MDSFHDVFCVVKEICKKNLSATAYNLWIHPIHAIDLKDNVAFLYVSSDFQKNIVDTKYTIMLQDAFKEVLGFDISIKVLVKEEVQPENELTSLENKNMEDTKTSPQTDNNHTHTVQSEYTFENFIVGPSNTFAYAACRAVVKENSSIYNPLFIYAPSGLGKTHLLLSIYHALKIKYPENKIIYVNGETFANELIDSIGRRMMPEFREKYRSIDVLLMDDVQFLAGKTQTQEEFFHTFNDLYSAEKQIVLTSDRPPKDIRTLEERLRTRFEWGLIADIYPPDIETRIAVIRKKAIILNIEIPDPVVQYLAKNLKNNVRQLEGAVKKFKAYSLLSDTIPSINMAQSITREILSDKQPIPVTVEKIIEEIASTFNVSQEDIRSSKRSAQISQARQIAIYVIREITHLSYAEIGKEFNGRDHATILYALQKVEKMIKTNSEQKDIIQDIINNIRN